MGPFPCRSNEFKTKDIMILLAKEIILKDRREIVPSIWEEICDGERGRVPVGGNQYVSAIVVRQRPMQLQGVFHVPFQMQGEPAA